MRAGGYGRLMPIDPPVRDAIDELARYVRRPADVQEGLRLLVLSVVDTVVSADFASISVRNPDGSVETVAPTDRTAVELDRLQYDLHEGPCYEAASQDDRILIATDVAHDARWPRFGPGAASLGIGAMMAFALVVGDARHAALNLYAKGTGSFGPGVDVAEIFATHAAVAMGFSRSVRTLDAALASRTVIGLAIGIVMERYHVDQSKAFSFLTRVSQTSNKKLRDVAQQLVDECDDMSGDMPDAGSLRLTP